MVGPGRRRLGKMPIKPTQLVQNPSPRRSERLTPNKATPNIMLRNEEQLSPRRSARLTPNRATSSFQLIDEAEEQENQSTQQRSKRQLVAKRALDLTVETHSREKQHRVEISHSSPEVENQQGHEQEDPPSGDYFELKKFH